MIATSPDGQWAAVKRGLEIALFPGSGGPAAGRIELPTDDADVVMVGPPSVLAVVTRGPAAGELGNRVVLYQPPSPEVVASHDLDAAMRIAGLTGSRLVLVSRDGKAATIVRIAGRALGTQAVDPGTPVEFAVGLERNQVLLSLLRKLETWDAVSGRPLLRMQLALPPPPRLVGPAHGFLYMVYLVLAADLARRARWKLPFTVLVLLAGTVPFLSFVAERVVTRRVRAAFPLVASGAP